MAEREALKREIEQLQNLIKDHKRVHGDVPSSSTLWISSRRRVGRGQGHNPHYTHSYSDQSQPFAPHSTSYWRKTYSLNNKTNKVHGEGPAQFSDAFLNKPQHVNSAFPVAGSVDNRNVSGVSRVSPRGTAKAKTFKGSTACLQNITGKGSLVSGDNAPTTSAGRTVIKPTRTKPEIEIKSNAGVTGSSSLTDGCQSDLEKKESLNATLKTTVDMVCIPATSFVHSSCDNQAFSKNVTSAHLQMKPHITSNIASNRTVNISTKAKDIPGAQIVPPQSCSSPSLKLKIKSETKAQLQTTSSPHKRSQFTWVKSQRARNSQPEPDIHSTESSLNSVSASTVPSVKANIKQVHGSNKKVHRRSGLSTRPLRSSKYSWVSSSCSNATVSKVSLAKLPNRQLSPRALNTAGKPTKEGPDKTKKLTCTPSTLSKRTKVSGGTSTPEDSHGNRYRWKAVAQSPSIVSSACIPKTSRKGSVYRWTAQKEGKDPSQGSSSTRVQQNPITKPSPSSEFKLRSRTKIIRRSSSSNSTPERRSSLFVVTVRSRYSLRRRTHTSVKTTGCARRVQSRALISFGRHKLRRLSSSSTPTSTAWTPRTVSSVPSVRSPASQRVIKTRYKIDTRRAHLQLHNPALSYRVKRIQTARILLQSRLRTPPERQWRGRGMRWIGGALYRVSANKLSRTHTTSTSSVRSGKWFSPQDVSSPSSVVKTSMRHVASRAVQRSLAIIRQARQKKQQAKQYCMYYNRFGKCNRGSVCPYIHDPDKVAVCTRFLRGTCKQTDGTCPFSHKVSKEKMPVCSYFLKGICNNSSCPYSHVYVSRKAAVCQDFIRGYCPQGEKCKKKHTLVCPEFSSTGVCPRGSKCKLQHRQKAKRSGSNISSGPAKKSRTRDTAKSPEPSLTESTLTNESTPRTGLAKLPSFISLSSSPDTPETPKSSSCPSVAGAEATGKKLHIKPRF
ncbi:zinc finger CCCH domain-containing protein 3 [Hoplias malabaricus]|uniref:zinc finger CCCH domain-containing protein 3 n=1 Tax=Hoplias malabaricus TaxID=27720 RepID=UPI003462A56F